jgi:hypothetical protein
MSRFGKLAAVCMEHPAERLFSCSSSVKQPSAALVPLDAAPSCSSLGDQRSPGRLISSAFLCVASASYPWLGDWDDSLGALMLGFCRGLAHPSFRLRSLGCALRRLERGSNHGFLRYMAEAGCNGGNAYKVATPTFEPIYTLNSGSNEC